MPIGTLFWILMIFWAIGGFWDQGDNRGWRFGRIGLELVLFGLLGWKLFGPVIQ